MSLLSLCDCMAIDWSALTFTSRMVKRALLSPWRQSGPGTRCGGFRYPPQFVTAAVWQLNYYKCLRARVPGQLAAHPEVEDRQYGVVNVQPGFQQGGFRTRGGPQVN